MDTRTRAHTSLCWRPARAQISRKTTQGRWPSRAKACATCTRCAALAPAATPDLVTLLSDCQCFRALSGAGIGTHDCSTHETQWRPRGPLARACCARWCTVLLNFRRCMGTLRPNATCSDGQLPSPQARVGVRALHRTRPLTHTPPPDGRR